MERRPWYARCGMIKHIAAGRSPCARGAPSTSTSIDASSSSKMTGSYALKHFMPHIRSSADPEQIRTTTQGFMVKFHLLNGPSLLKIASHAAQRFLPLVRRMTGLGACGVTGEVSGGPPSEEHHHKNADRARRPAYRCGSTASAYGERPASSPVPSAGSMAVLDAELIHQRRSLGPRPAPGGRKSRFEPRNLTASIAMSDRWLDATAVMKLCRIVPSARPSPLHRPPGWLVLFIRRRRVTTGRGRTASVAPQQSILEEQFRHMVLEAVDPGLVSHAPCAVLPLPARLRTQIPARRDRGEGSGRRIEQGQVVALRRHHQSRRKMSLLSLATTYGWSSCCRSSPYRAFPRETPRISLTNLLPL